MALGGWIYHTMSIPDFDSSNDGLFQTNVVDPLITLLSGISGWSVSLAKTKYRPDIGYHFRLSHSGGAELAVACYGYTSYIADTYIDASNAINNARLDVFDVRYRIFFSYWPPGHSGVGAVDPGVAGYVPSDGFGFTFCARANAIQAGHTARIHIMARGDDLIYSLDYDSQVADVAVLMGSHLEPLHAGDVGSRNAECTVLRWSNAYSSTSRHFSCFAADNTTRIWYDPGIIDNYTWLTSSINSAAPWSWVPAIVGRPFYVGNTGPGSSVSSLSGVKGRISHESFRWTVPSSGPANKQQLVSGNLIHLTEGVVLGWDPSNGAMS